MSRRTDLSLERLLALLPGAKSCDEAGEEDGLPKGCIVNEIGQIFWSSGGDSVAAEEALVDLITNGSDPLKWVAWKYLTELDPEHPALSLQTQEAVAEYEAAYDPSR